MFVPIAIGVTIGAATVAVTVATRPAGFVITRSAVLAAPADALFTLVNDFHLWEQWSPYAKLDPNMKVTYEGAPAGVGAVYHWSGNNKAGTGRMAITESAPARRIKIDLSFSKPMKAEHKAEFTFEPVSGASGATKVTWAMTGDRNFVGKAFALIVDLDKLVGTAFEEGLRNLGSVAASASARTLAS
jgi:uncharacterized protein YndB with AHSA1/START domain